MWVNINKNKNDGITLTENKMADCELYELQ